jgi:zinc transport system substrate-binding protein
MKKSFLLLVIISLILVGCGYQQIHQTENTTPPPQKTQREEITKKQIIASFYPLAFMTEQIVENKAEVTNIAGSADVHEYEPSPQDMVKLNKADLVIFQGAELEPWIDGVISELRQKGIMTLEVTHDLELTKMEEHEEEHYEVDEHDDHEDKHEDDHADEKEEGHEEHHHGEFDPHTWLDPVLAQQMVDRILEVVVTVDPVNKTTYQANAHKLKSRFAKLDKNFQTILSQCINNEVIVSHDAYGYLSRRYGFEIHPIIGLSTQDEPSAKILGELKEEANEGITHILIEENNIRRFANTLVAETGLETLPINPLGRGTLDLQKDFFDVMEANLQSLQLALDCQQ